VTAEIAEIAQGWERLSGKAKGTTLASSRLRDLAKQAGCEGYISRGDERLKESLDYDGDKTKTVRPSVRRDLRKIRRILVFTVEVGI
jgi:hypothetical protein